jgi:nicotinate-nucleotide adenylyltransferase
MKKLLRVGLLGGTFDPVHNGHLAMADAGIRLFQFDIVYFVTSVSPPHKSRQTQANFLDRHAMVALALLGRPRMVPSSLEYGRPGVSYSIDTVRQLRRDLGVKTEIYFLIGMDAFLELPTWKEYQRLIDYCRFVVYTRPGFDEGTLQMRLPRALVEKIAPVPKTKTIAAEPEKRIYLIRGFSNHVSSTAIRKRVQQGSSLAGFVPPAVREYIHKAGLYHS